MEIKQMSKDVATEIKSKKEYLETFKNAPTKNAPTKVEKDKRRIIMDQLAQVSL